MTSVAETLKHKRKLLPQPDSALAIPDACIGIEVEVEGCSPRNVRYPHPWTGKEDGSLRNGGWEFVTDGPVIGDQIFKAVDAFCEYANKCKFSVGYPRAGIHIHVDCTDLNAKRDTDLWALNQVYMFVEHALFAWCAQHSPADTSPWRRWVGYCDALADSRYDFSDLSEVLLNWKATAKKGTVSNWLARTSKYQAINYIPLVALGTVEFRHMPTTFDAGVIKTWINFILAIKKAAVTVLADESFNLCQEFSRRGGRALLLHLLGEYGKPLIPFLDEAECWRSIDAIQGFAGYQQANRKVISWDAPDNPLLLEKFKIKEENVAKPSKDSLVEQINNPVNAEWMQRALDAVQNERAQVVWGAGRLADRIMDGQVFQVLDEQIPPALEQQPLPPPDQPLPRAGDIIRSRRVQPLRVFDPNAVPAPRRRGPNQR